MTKKRFDFYDIILWILYIGITIMVLVTLYLLVRAYVADQFVIPTNSMEPTLIPGDRIIVNKLIAGARIYDEYDFEEGATLKSHRTWGIRKVEHNDIVIFNFPINHKKQKIEFKLNFVYGKRCIGLPGDSVSVEDGYFCTNTYSGEFGDMEQQRILSMIPDSVVHKSIDRPFDPFKYGWTVKNFGPIYVPHSGDNIVLDKLNYLIYKSVIEFESSKKLHIKEGGVLMLGDGVIDGYMFTKNYYFMCGDNVQNSDDSRYWGFVPEEFIIGVVSHITYSRDRNSGEFRWDRFLKSVLK